VNEATADVREPNDDDIPRGPHLPDALTALSATALVFLMLAIARVIWFVRDWDQPAANVAAVVSFVASVVPAVGAVLLPAVLAIRHPEAPIRARALYLGTVLIAFVEGMRVFNSPLRPFFEQATPPDPETPFFVPLAIAFGAVAGGAGAFAMALIARGLADARRFADRSSIRPVMVIVALVVVLVSVGRVLALRQLQWEQIPLTPIVIVYVGSTILLGIASIAAWGYLIVSAVAGFRAGEEPEAGWTLVAAGACIVVTALAGNAALGLVTPNEQSQELLLNVVLLDAVVFATGYLAILGGFLLGLPSLAEVRDELNLDEAASLDDQGAEAEAAGTLEVA
jgi:hypothetical protein